MKLEGAKRPSAEWSKSPYTPIGRHLTIIYPKRLANPVIFLSISDNPGPLGNVCRAVSVQTLRKRTPLIGTRALPATYIYVI